MPQPPPPSMALLTFSASTDIARLEHNGVELSLTATQAETVLRVTAGHTTDWPGVTFKHPDGGQWDLSTWKQVEVDVRNVGPNQVTVCCRVDDPAGDGSKHCVTRSVELAPGATGTIEVPMPQRAPEGWPKLFGMRGFPDGLAPDEKIAMDTSQVVRLIVFIPKPKEDHAFELGEVRASGKCITPPWIAAGPDKFFPLIDEYGQFIHTTWPGKTLSDADFATRRADEGKDLTARPGPANRTPYGGWQSGPQLPATGFFRVEKQNGKWWLIDPEGRLFWSHGVDCVSFWNATTPITDRENWFRNLPPKDSPLGKHYGKGNWAPHNYYENKTYETFNFGAANLSRKYGEGWEKMAADTIHLRLRSWGLNTIANWSHPDIYLLRRTPYVCTIHSGGRNIEGSEGYWGQFKDVFDPKFAEALRKRLASETGKSAGDPWCLGYFVDNELSWGDEFSLALAALQSPPDQPAKLAFVEDLKAKFNTIEALNAAWGTAHASWDALLACRQGPDKGKAKDDLGAFYSKLAETYFRICRETVKEVAPNQLFLGCRFAWVNDRAVRASEKYCDVISYNLYRKSVAEFRLPGDMDRPVIIGEFHFGALDRGLFHTGLVPVPDQAARAQAYTDYVTGALRNPLIVGSHWFEYMDESTTGRGDGENYQIGLVDACDTPYPETIQAVRNVGYAMYDTRSRP
ncbi:MAG: hypothetical protein A3K19_14380 [Lentisphaerae bacterium RIFOXYB12_FULL_65_16]|nr:MAG: hypothetical protein A3K18_18425 [Lentisphaerae bacterium RIFOXYA12_64_32]OGV87410.1 MAG: hypothetical protein A3K19_14380 [Lentisphaerae bacterium RIFOXYB12_FULL_65_16]